MQETCSVKECEGPVRARGYCVKHYAAARRRGEFISKICSQDGCSGAVYGLGVCNRHYQGFRRANPTDAARKLAQERGCAVDGCNRPWKSINYCHMHYERWRTTGDVGDSEPSRQPNGSWFIANGYMRRKENGRVILQHREVMEQVLGRPLERHETVHHKNGDKQDNRPENLQLRSGRHGKGVVHRCLDCGSTNIGSEEL